MTDTPTEAIIHHPDKINPPSITQTIERDYGVCKEVAGKIVLVKDGVVVILDNPEARKKTADTFNWSQEERKKLNEEVLIGNLRKKLIEKYPEQKCFFDESQIKLMQLGDNTDKHNQMRDRIKGNIFLLFGLDGKLLSYLNEDGTTNFDISSFNFDDDFGNLLNKKLSKKEGNSYIIKKDGKLFLYNPEQDIYYPEGNINFNVYIFAFYLKTLR